MILVFSTNTFMVRKPDWAMIHYSKILENEKQNELWWPPLLTTTETMHNVAETFPQSRNLFNKHPRHTIYEMAANHLSLLQSVIQDWNLKPQHTVTNLVTRSVNLPGQLMPVWICAPLMLRLQYDGWFVLFLDQNWHPSFLFSFTAPFY